MRFLKLSHVEMGNPTPTRSLKAGALMIIAAVLVAAGTIQAQRYELVWSDEFDSDELNRDTWVLWDGPAFNNELQCYVDNPKNLYIEDGVLHLVAHRETVQCSSRSMSFTSARISTDSTRIGWEHGRFEARIQMPTGQGFWPAFWLMPMRRIGWPRGGEIDIMEYRGNRVTETNAAVHFWREGCTSTLPQCHTYIDRTYETGTDLSADFHIYALEWTPEYFRWFFNDVMYYELHIPSIQADSDPFTGPFHIIMNLAVGGNYLPNPTSATVFPQALKVDYVRVFQNKNVAPVVDLEDTQARFDAGEPLRFEINAFDDDGTVDTLWVYFEDDMIKAFTAPPYIIELDPPMEGCYELAARAKDNNGAWSDYIARTIQVGHGCAPAPWNDEPFSVGEVIPMWQYNRGGQNVGYFETTPEANQGSALHEVPRAFEAVDLMPVDHPDTEFSVFESTGGDWMSYTVSVPEAGNYVLSVELSALLTSSMDVFLNGELVSFFNRIRTAPGERVFREVSLADLPAGEHEIRIVSRSGNLQYFVMMMEPGEPVSVPREQEALPAGFNLHPVYPNPFNPSAVVTVEAGEAGFAEVAVYTLVGQRAATLFEGVLPAGISRFDMNLSGMASGVYVVILRTEDGFRQTTATLLR
jgi:beta-glucanase (GH16 family)